MTVKRKSQIICELYENFRPRCKQSKRIIKKFHSQTKGTVFYDGSTLNQASHLINLIQLWFGKVLDIKKILMDKREKELWKKFFIKI